MKKLMTTAVVAAVALRGAMCFGTEGSAVVSSDIVGYTTIEIPNGWSTFTPVFDEINGGDFDWTEVEVLDANESQFDDATNPSRNQVRVRFLASGGTLDTTTYQYSTMNNRKWSRGTSSITKGQFTVRSGEGVLINNSRSSKVLFRISGRVNVLPSYSCPSGWSVWGNNTPVAIDFKDVVLTDENGNAFDDATNPSRNQVRIRLLGSSGTLATTTYQYSTMNNRKWSRGTSSLTAGQFVVQPGEAFLVQNSRQNIVNLTLPSPVPNK